MTEKPTLRQRRPAKKTAPAPKKARIARAVRPRRRLEPRAERRLHAALLVPAIMPSVAYLTAELFRHVRVGAGAVPLQDFVDFSASLAAAPFSAGAALVAGRTRHPAFTLGAVVCVGATMMAVGMHAAANSARGLLRGAHDQLGLADEDLAASVAETWRTLYWFDEDASHAIYLVAHFTYLAVLAFASDLLVPAPLATLATAAWHGAIVAVLCIEAGMPYVGYAGAALVLLALVASRRDWRALRSDVVAAFSAAVAVSCLCALSFYRLRVGSWCEPYACFGSVGKMVAQVFLFQAAPASS